MVNSILRTPHNSFLEALKKDSAFAESVSNDFVATMKHLEVISFFETKRYKNFGKVVNISPNFIRFFYPPYINEII